MNQAVCSWTPDFQESKNNWFKISKETFKTFKNLLSFYKKQNESSRLFIIQSVDKALSKTPRNNWCKISKETFKTFENLLSFYKKENESSRLFIIQSVDKALSKTQLSKIMGPFVSLRLGTLYFKKQLFYLRKTPIFETQIMKGV